MAPVGAFAFRRGRSRPRSAIRPRLPAPAERNARNSPIVIPTGMSTAS
jgi:hypothetical protein